MNGNIRLGEVNFVFISGRLTRDCDIRMTGGGQTVCGFDVAVNRRYLDNASQEWKDDVAYVPVTVFGQTADRIKDRLRKGIPVLVEGRITMNEFTDKSGQNRKVLRVNARRVQILQSMSDAPSPGGREPAASEEAADDDVPF
jgi:single-strand DNA-binding protein